MGGAQVIGNRTELARKPARWRSLWWPMLLMV